MTQNGVVAALATDCGVTWHDIQAMHWPGIRTGLHESTPFTLEIVHGPEVGLAFIVPCGRSCLAATQTHSIGCSFRSRLSKEECSTLVDIHKFLARWTGACWRFSSIL